MVVHAGSCTRREVGGEISVAVLQVCKIGGQIPTGYTVPEPELCVVIEWLILSLLWVTSQTRRAAPALRIHCARISQSGAAFACNLFVKINTTMFVNKRRHDANDAR